MIKEKCSKCGFDAYNGALHIHHLDGNHNNNTLENLQVLCANCHMELHHKDKKTTKIKRDNRLDTIRELQLKIDSLEFNLSLFRKSHNDLNKIIRCFQEYVPIDVRTEAFQEHYQTPSDEQMGEIARNRPIL